MVLYKRHFNAYTAERVVAELTDLVRRYRFRDQRRRYFHPIDVLQMPLYLARCIPRAYIDRILSSNPVKRRWWRGTIFGSKLPWRSSGTSISTSPKSPFSVSALVPLRELLLPFPSGVLLIA